MTNLRDRYEVRAVKAKKTFIKDLMEWMDRRRVNQTELAKITGFSSGFISGILNDPVQTTESAIRVMTVKCPGLEAEYQKFRAFVDLPYLPKGSGEDMMAMPPDNLLRHLAKSNSEVGEALTIIGRIIAPIVAKS